MNLYRARRLRNAIASALAVGATAVGLCWLGMVLGILIWNGLGGLSLRLFVENTPPPGASGGLLNAIVGSTLLVLGAVALGERHSGCWPAPGWRNMAAGAAHADHAFRQ